MRPVFELRRDPVTGWWAAVVTDRTFEHASFAVEAAPVEGTHCRHCDEDPTSDAEAAEAVSVRRVPLRPGAFHRLESSSGSWEILVAPRGHHERLSDAAPRLALNLLRSMREAMIELGTGANPPDERVSVQVVQSYGRQAGSRSSHLNLELYAIPLVPHWLAEEIGGGARHQIRTRTCVWCGLARTEEEAGERLVLAEERFVVFAPAASRSPFELMVVPRAQDADLTQLHDDDLAATAATLQRTLHALEALGDPPYNLFLHTAPAGERLDQTFHWHWEIHPRLRVIAGLERATALAVNPATPEYAAEILRERVDR